MNTLANTRVSQTNDSSEKTSELCCKDLRTIQGNSST